MDRLSLAELRRRLDAYSLRSPVPDANADLARTALGHGRRLVSASLRLHPGSGVGEPAFLLLMEGPAGKEAVLVAPGPASFALIEEALGAQGEVETDVLPILEDGALAKLADPIGASVDRRRPAPTPGAGSEPSPEEEERVFRRIVCAANPAVATELIEATVDVLLDEVDGERAIVALARDGLLRPEIARLRGGRGLPDPGGDVPRRIFERVVATRRPVFVEDVLEPTLSLVPSESMRALHVRTFLAAPLLEEGEVTGILYIDRRDRPTRFDARARQLFERLARRIEGIVAHALARGAAEAEFEDRGVRGFLDLVGNSKPMRALFRQIQRLGGQDVDVLILGETGTGKELVARALHLVGKRKERRYEAINCAALPETLLESTLFGHVRGAFTGAERDRPGLFTETDGGTLFLDEVGDMPPALQVKLLRTLDLGEVRPVGATRALSVDVRFYAATHRDLREMVDKGEFREDLYYRLTSAETVLLPPLRERPGDVAALAQHFVEEFAAKHALRSRRFAASALERLAAHPWSGNVRELRNVVLHTVLRATGEVVRAQDIVFTGTRPATARLAAALPASEADVVPFKEHVRAYLARVHELTSGNVTRMAELVGEPRETVRDWLRKCGIHTTRTIRTKT